MTNKEAIKRRYTFGNDEFNLEAAYHDCKLVFDGITDDDSFQEADTGLILYYANEIIYALHEALEGKDTNVPSNDTISRQQAIDAVVSAMIDGADAELVEGVMELLPSAQPEIIRCTECKHYREYDSKYVENAVVVQCMADRYPISEIIPDGWFCAGAERKDDE